jgi:hypothetical protein
MKSTMVVYLLCLGMMIGLELAAGAFVAPVIFFPQKLLGDGVLSHFQSGMLMTEIFLRMNFLLLFFSAISFSFELLMWISKAKISDKASLLLSVTALVLTTLFTYYYTPFIVDAQSRGELATASEAFREMHKQSEWVMKGLMMVQIGLFIRRGIALGR